MKSKLAGLKCHVLLNNKCLKTSVFQAILHFQDRHDGSNPSEQVQYWRVPLGRLSLNKDPG